MEIKFRQPIETLLSVEYSGGVIARKLNINIQTVYAWRRKLGLLKGNLRNNDN